MEDSPHLSPHNGYSLYRIRVDLPLNAENTLKVEDILSHLVADYWFVCHEISKDVNKGHYQGFFESEKVFNFPSSTVDRWVVRKYPELKGKGRRALSSKPVAVGYAAKDGNLVSSHGYTTSQKDEFLRLGKLYIPPKEYHKDANKKTKQEIFSEINETTNFSKQEILYKVLSHFRENNRIYNLHQLDTWCYTLYHRQHSIDEIVKWLLNDEHFRFFNINDNELISNPIL